MQVDFDTAQEVYAKLPDKLKSPYFHPCFVVNDALRDKSLQAVFFIYRDGGEIFYYAFHLGKVIGTRYFDIQSPYAYGGPLSSTTDPDFLAIAWQHYLAWCQGNHVLAEFVRFHPLLGNWSYYPGETEYLRETVLIDLRQKDRFSSYATRVRTAIRKAEKHHLRVEWRDPPSCGRAFFELYNQAMVQLQADQFYFFPDDYFQQLSNWPQCYLTFCLKGDDILAAALFLKESDVMEYHLAATSPEGKKWCASNFILDQAVMRAGQLGCRILHLGGGTDNCPDNPLLFFKSGFSPQRASFLIGKVIHLPEAYAELQRKWQERYGKVINKILFYRF